MDRQTDRQTCGGPPQPSGSSGSVRSYLKREMKSTTARRSSTRCSGQREQNLSTAGSSTSLSLPNAVAESHPAAPTTKVSAYRVVVTIASLREHPSAWAE